MRGRAMLVAGALLGALATAGGAAVAAGMPRRAPVATRIVAVGAESQYANVIAQVGGAAVSVHAVMKNPDADPHSFEASPTIAQLVSSASLVVQNGLGYDGFMNQLEAASPSPARRVITVRALLHLPESTRNPHLWYRPSTMPAVAGAVARALAAIDPAHAARFVANASRFDRSLQPERAAIAALRRRARGAAVATTEPVADYLISALGLRNATPWTLQADVMNGVDPAPQDVQTEENLLSHRRVKAFLYNAQVTDSLTASFAALAAANHVPIVAVYETMPSGFSYQSWMLAEIRAIRRALVGGRSTRSL